MINLKFIIASLLILASCTEESDNQNYISANSEKSNSKYNCQINEDCQENELCDVKSGNSEYGFCNDVSNYYFEITVLRYSQDNCNPKTFNHFFDYRMDNKYQQSSSNSNSCPSSWNIKLLYDPMLSFEIDFQKIIDNGKDASFESFNFSDLSGKPLKIPKIHLHNGYFVNDKIELLIESL